MKRRYLIDMDGVIANFEQGFLDDWRASHPDQPFVALDQRSTFYAEDQYPRHLKSLVQQIPLRKGFFADLPVMPGSQEALEDLASSAEVFICTSPMTHNPYCASEKLLWMEKHFGPEWKRRTIITKDKTLVRGDVLVDDRPTVTGADEPLWEHVHYAHPFNEGHANRRITWQNYQEVLGL